MSRRVELIAVDGVPLIESPVDLGTLVCRSLESSQGAQLADGDILVVAQKLVSKAEGNVVDLTQLEPGRRAEELARASGKDARLVEVILRESTDVVRAVGPHLIMEHRLGLVCANAGVDRSNAGGKERAVLLPRDPDGSARQIREAVRLRLGREVAVIVTDSHGRPFRVGSIGVAIGVAGMAAIESWKGRHDLDGRVLESSEQAVADELACAASLLMGQGDGARPLVIVRGFAHSAAEGSARDLIRSREMDLFRS